MSILSASIRARLIASGVHLLGSITVISAYLALVLLVWYPDPYYLLHSTSHVIRILVGVDVVLGPLFTLIVFNLAKPRKELVRDLSLIVVVQLAALLWGVAVTYQMRPLFLVFQEGTWYSIVRQDIATDRLPDDVALPTWWQRPRLLYIEPLTTEEKIKVGAEAVLRNAPDVMYQAERYRPFSPAFREDALRQAMPSQELTKAAEQGRELREFLERHPGTAEDYAFFPVENGGVKATLVVRRGDFSVVGLLGLR